MLLELDCFKQSSLRHATVAPDKVNAGADRICDGGYGNNFYGETQRAWYIDNRVDREKERGQGNNRAGDRRDTQPHRRAGTNRAGAKDRNYEHHEVNDAVKNIGGVVDQLKRFLDSGPDLAGNRDHKRGRADEDDRIDRGFVSRVQAREPARQ